MQIAKSNDTATLRDNCPANYHSTIRNRPPSGACGDCLLSQWTISKGRIMQRDIYYIDISSLIQCPFLLDFPAMFDMISGWWYTYPSEKYEFVSWDDDIPNKWKNKIRLPNHQPAKIHPILLRSMSSQTTNQRLSNHCSLMGIQLNQSPRLGLRPSSSTRFGCPGHNKPAVCGI
jgi:hypothetical protein